MTELTDEQLLKLAAAALDYASITPPGGHLSGAYEADASGLLAYGRAGIAADRAARPQPTAEALQAAYADWFKANQGIPPSPTAARAAALFTMAVLLGEVEL